MPRRWTIDPHDAHQRLDAWLARRLAISRSAVRRLLADAAVRVDGRVIDPRGGGAALSAGAVVELDPDADADRVEPQPEMPLTVLGAGAGWLAVDKPAGVPVHPLKPAERDTLLNAVAARFPGIVGIGEKGLRGGVVHRLDVQTSGVTIFATEQAAWDRLRDAFASHRVEKTYRAIVAGPLSTPGRVALTLRVAEHRPAIVRVCQADYPDGRLCALSWRFLESFGPAALIEVSLETGFLHQIRAMMLHLGHPVLGDPDYATSSVPPIPAPRQLLHAASIVIDAKRIDSPDPADFSEALDRLRSRHDQAPLTPPRQDQ